MSVERAHPLDPRVQSAVKELEGLITAHYPHAHFRVTRGPEDPEEVWLEVVVDVEDTDEVVDLVIDRMLALQIEQGLPVYVLPLRPPDRVRVSLSAPSARRSPVHPAAP